MKLTPKGTAVAARPSFPGSLPRVGAPRQQLSEDVAGYVRELIISGRVKQAKSPQMCSLTPKAMISTSLHSVTDSFNFVRFHQQPCIS